MDFQKLERLRGFLRELRDVHSASLTKYFHSDLNGFAHRLDLKKFSMASTATSVMSLVAAAEWQNDPPGPWKGRTEDVAKAILAARWRSGELQEGNIFSSAFALESLAILILGDEHEKKFEIDPKGLTKINEALEKLTKSLEGREEGTEKGAAKLDEYPPNAYLTQLVVRVLKRYNRLDEEPQAAVRDWAFREITRQITLLLSEAKTADIYSLAYSTILVASVSNAANTSPDDARILRTAVDKLFAAQRKDGLWPSGRPLFHYPNVGSAYCYEYEMLVQLLQHSSENSTLKTALLDHLEDLSKAAYALEGTNFDLGGRARGWASGHHPQLKGPESWSTASVFHFAYALDRLVAEAVRIELFRYVDQEYYPPLEPRSDDAEFAPPPVFLDCNVKIPGQGSTSLRKTLFDRFVKPLAESTRDVAQGRPFSERAKVSAIFFGPPGTSKTKLTKFIADFLQWPRLVIDPSHLVRTGMDLIQAEANKLFEMIAAAEQIVVLFDEFDEIVRERTSQNSEMISRLLTTAMLPKLSQIYDRRRVVFILATNHINQFDFAISRLGRFDIVVQVMPPTVAAKFENWKTLSDHLKKLDTDVDALESDLSVLAFKEFEAMVPKLMKAETAPKAVQIVKQSAKKCILRQKPFGGKETWEQKAAAEGKSQNRI